MLHQSKIRKTALCLIYAVMEHKCSEQDFPYKHFWEITLEKEQEHLRRALAKGILHACRSASDVGGLFIERGEAFLTEQQDGLARLSLREELERCVERTKAIMKALTDLRLCLNDKRRDSSEPLEQACRKVIQLAQTIIMLSEGLLLRLEDEPGLAGALRRWVRTLAECAQLAHPEQLTDSKEYAGLAHKAKELAELRPAAEEMAREILSLSEEWEISLQRLLRNYVPERLDAVDKAILYIGLYELQHRKLGAAIAISEAINLAHEFSGAKSAPFIHGVLAAAALETTDTAN